MVQDISTTTIPEELYNLTQLAEVTLAAGRLSTTNVNEITDYINNEKLKNDSPKINANPFLTTDNKQPKFRRRHTIPENWSETNESTHQDRFLESGEHSVIRRNHSIGENIYKSSSERMQFFSSSDDDSNYYSHKIFDKKKSRRSTVSDSHSKFDELSCSSLPSNASICSGDEHSSGTISKTMDGKSPMTEDDHVCPECGKKYSTSSNLARHRQTHRSILDKKARRCPHCEKIYVSMPAYSMHVRTHNQGCKCPHCGKCFSRPWLLQGHIRTHTGEKPFKCEICSKAFADKSNLRAHIQTHSNTKPHACNRCGKAFALKSYLYKHEESSCMRNHLKQEKDRSHKQKSDSTKLPREKPSTSTYSPSSIRALNPPPTGIMWMPDTTPLESSEPKSETFDEPPQKSYTTLTSPTSPDDFDRFARISVIRNPISPSNYDSSGGTGTLQLNFYQENPVDFSPKNNFTHSMKTSPFELTRSYAIVA